MVKDLVTTGVILALAGGLFLGYVKSRENAAALRAEIALLSAQYDSAQAAHEERMAIVLDSLAQAQATSDSAVALAAISRQAYDALALNTGDLRKQLTAALAAQDTSAVLASFDTLTASLDACDSALNDCSIASIELLSRAHLAESALFMEQEAHGNTQALLQRVRDTVPTPRSTTTDLITHGAVAALAYLLATLAAR
jgi:hypothetical protein